MVKSKISGESLEYKIKGDLRYVLAEAGAIDGTYDRREFLDMLDRASFDDIKSKRRKNKLEEKKEKIKTIVRDYPDEIKVENFAKDHTSLMIKKGQLGLIGNISK